MNVPSETTEPLTYSPILWAVGLSVVSVAGDYLLKRSSTQSSPFASRWFFAGFALYSSTALGWVYVMRHMKFAMIGIVYAVSTLLLLTFVGVFFLSEPLHWPEMLGIGLALASIALLVRFA